MQSINTLLITTILLLNAVSLHAEDTNWDFIFSCLEKLLVRAHTRRAAVAGDNIFVHDTFPHLLKLPWTYYPISFYDINNLH